MHTACVHHSLQLVTHCPACTKPLQWLRSQVDSCPCGFELQDSPQTVVDKAMRFTDQQELMQVAMLVAFELADATGTLRLDALRDLPIDVLEAKVITATDALRAGQDRLNVLLLSITNRRAAQNGALGQRWPLLPVLMGLKEEPAASDWLRANMAGLSVQTRNAELCIETLSLAETAVLLNVSEHVVKQRCAKGQLKKLADRTGQTPMLICAQSIAAHLATPPPTSPAPLMRESPPGTMTVIDAAGQLGIYPDAIRRVIKAGLLPSQKGIGTQVLLQATDVAEFQREYVFVKELAAAWVTNHTNLAERLMAVGVQPVSGPAIDGGLVYLFRRAEVGERIREPVCSLSSYATKAGRKLAGKQAEQLAGYLTAQQVADDLGVSIQQVAQLVVAGYLQESRPEGITSNRRYIRAACLANYCAKYRGNPDLVTQKLAAKALGLTPKQFQKRYIETGIVKAHSDGFARYVPVAVLESLRQEREQLIDTTEATRRLGAPRYYFINLIKIGRISPVSGPTIDGSKHYYFRRDEIAQLMPELAAVKQRPITATEGNGNAD